MNVDRDRQLEGIAEVTAECLPRAEAIADFSEWIKHAVKERARFIAGNEETFIEAWIAQHGFKPDEMQIIRQDMPNGSIRIWVERRGERDELMRLRAKLARVETLPNQWRNNLPALGTDPAAYAMRARLERLIEELEAALKGGV